METDRLSAGIDLGLRRVADTFPGRSLQLLSGLAEGADRLVARSVLRLDGGQLLAALPLPRGEYQRDFATEASQREFEELLAAARQVVELPFQADRKQAYQALGGYLVAHSEVLLAIWDGQGAQGRGGTGEVVAMARQRGLPLIWVHAGNRKPGTEEPTSLGAEQGQVTYERL
jgi:hypothetical protein